jgi:hypothetical protein
MTEILRGFPQPVRASVSDCPTAHPSIASISDCPTALPSACKYLRLSHSPSLRALSTSLLRVQPSIRRHKHRGCASVRKDTVCRDKVICTTVCPVLCCSSAARNTIFWFPGDSDAIRSCGRVFRVLGAFTRAQHVVHFQSRGRVPDSGQHWRVSRAAARLRQLVLQSHHILLYEPEVSTGFSRSFRLLQVLEVRQLLLHPTKGTLVLQYPERFWNPLGLLLSQQKVNFPL